METVTQIEELRSIYKQLSQSRDEKQPVIRVCMGPGCLAQGADKVATAFKGLQSKT
jgi:NADH:ubiquinone oxidoreductase subunit E